jgi:cation transport regulator ChaC
MPRAERSLIFGYGSLLQQRTGATPESDVTCHLEGFRRSWNVAMDNARTIAGYKFYVDPETGARPAVFVTFLNIEADADRRVNGLLYPVEDALLPLLDRRERNYERRDVTELVDRDVGCRVWAYLGRRDARERYETARREASAVVSQQYFDRVRADFARFGPTMLDEFDGTTDPPEVPLRSLQRVNVPLDPDADGANGAADPARQWAVEGVV